ncbi:ubiquinol-cytochrome-c reductase cytochrome c1 protein [Rutstroemia sp. NJR-2017a BBW]|nr:ubiquinol-cytochrome-c reductase cytochrome c1 protein [Rutstroemia sp. NJR-2017a BBW]
MSGLQASIWASGNYGYSRSARPLNFSNTASTRENAPVSITHSHPSPPATVTPKTSSIIGDKSYGSGNLSSTTTKGSGGLTTSRWAVRDYSRKSKATDHGEVWTKVASISTTALTPHAHNASASPDLGLPYEVQHYILGMMQRLMEEACYAFASRWIPKVLQRNNWTCSEAVELSVWKTILPENVPAEALLPMTKTLQQCLSDAVRIRNAATHRHLCTNFELQRMTLQAEDLMVMLSDRTRQAKFNRLWAELNEWERNSASNMQAARHKMEMALQEIGERPMDDMDWTPNAISLQELSPVEQEVKEIKDFEDHHDAMELD